MKNKFEERIIENLTLEKEFSKAKEVIKRDEIKLEDFEDLYGKENVQKDKEYVRKMEYLFNKERNSEKDNSSKLATIFESVIHEHGELSDWFGSSAFTIKTSRYDDIKNGVDEIVEFIEENKKFSHLALGVDVTIANETYSKFKKIIDEINQGKLAEIKYFKSDELGIRGELKNVPRVIISVEGKTVRELGGMWLEGKNKELSEHFIQYQILEEILLQSKFFSLYAEKKNQIKIKDTYEHLNKIIENIYQQKIQNKKEVNKTYGKDRAFYTIKDILNFFEENYG